MFRAVVVWRGRRFGGEAKRKEALRYEGSEPNSSLVHDYARMGNDGKRVRIVRGSRDKEEKEKREAGSRGKRNGKNEITRGRRRKTEEETERNS